MKTIKPIPIKTAKLALQPLQTSFRLTIGSSQQFFMYVSVKQLASNLNVSTTRVRKLIGEGRIKGAFKIGNVWAIPVVDGKPEATNGRRES